MGAGASVPDDVNCILPPPENGGAMSCGTGAVFVVDVVSGRGFSKLTSKLDRDVIDPFVTVKVNDLAIAQTDAKENETKPFFNQRFVFLVPADQMADGKVTFALMDKDTMSSNDLMASAKMPLPPPMVPTVERLSLEVNEVLGMCGDAEAKLDIGCILIPISDMLKAPVLVSQLTDQISALQADDEADEALKADLRAQIEEMVVDDADDEAQKTEMMEKIAALDAEMAAAKQAEADRAAEQEASLQAIKDEMAAKEAEMAAAEEAAAASLTAAEGSDEAQKAHIETITGLLGNTKNQLKDSQNQLMEAKIRIRELEQQAACSAEQRKRQNQKKTSLKAEIMGKKKKKK